MLQKTNFTFDQVDYKGYILSVSGSYDPGYIHRDHSFSIYRVDVVDNEDNSPLPSDINIGELEDYILENHF